MSKQNIYNLIIVIVDSTSPNDIYLNPKHPISELISWRVDA